MSNLLTVYTHKDTDTFMQEVMQMNIFRNQPSRYEEITCQVCGAREEYGDAFDKQGWFDVSVCRRPEGYYEDELEDGYICDGCGESMGFVHCCFCGTTMREPFTNNPWPACEDEDARCCSDCNAMVVMPARMKAVC